MARKFKTLVSVAACAALGGIAAISHAQTFPSKPMRILVPFTAGSQTDITARLVASRLSEAWGQQVVVDNRGGAGGTVGTGISAEATPDGYTMLAHSSGYAIAPALYPKWKVNMQRDFQPITTLVATPHVIVTSPSLGPKTLKEFIEFARSKGDGFSWSSAGNGSGTHFCGEIFMLAAKINHNHIAYKGTPEALVDAITGRVNVFFSPLGAAMPFIKNGKAQALAVTSKDRNPALANVPTADEAGLPGFDVSLWFILATPAKTPKAIVDKVWADTTKILKSPDIVKNFAATGVVTVPRSVAETEAFVAKELKTFAEIAKAAKIPTF